jgi:hypothetical protein
VAIVFDYITIFSFNEILLNRLHKILAIAHNQTSPKVRSSCKG